MLAICVFAFSCGSTEDAVKDSALRSSVQISTYLPVIKVSFTSPLAKDEPFNAKIAGDILDARIEGLKESIREEIKAEITKSAEGRYESAITNIETWIESSKSKTAIPIGSLKGVPKWAKFPDTVLVAYKTEEKNIKPWEKDAEEDVLSISETVGVSISKAKEMLLKIQAKGYTVSKEEVKPDAEITLLWFDDGWSDSYPNTLKWSVIVEGTESNLLTGYDPRGILLTKPMPDNKKIFIKCGYIDLMDRHKPKSSEFKSLEKEVERLEDLRDKLEKDKEKLREEATKKDPKKWERDITLATMYDVVYGIVKIETFWTESVGTGVFIGNQNLSGEKEGSPSYWGGARYQSLGQDYGFILTNAHVANDSLERIFYVSDDHEVMMLVGPGYPYIRYTDSSDSIGSPAFVLTGDGEPVLSRDYDCAVMVTQKVPGYNINRARLGDSGKIKGGERICFAGNPMGMQKFLTTGIVSKGSYSLADSKWGSYFLKWGGKLMTIKNIWYDATVGHGGSSGSGVFAMSGSETGKVIGLHHMGLQTAVIVSEAKAETTIPKSSISMDDIVINSGWSGLIKNITKEQTEKLFKDYSFRDAKFEAKSIIELKNDDEALAEVLTTKFQYVMVPMGGMNAAIPIDVVKQYLQERGLSPDHFEFEGQKDWGS